MAHYDNPTDRWTSLYPWLLGFYVYNESTSTWDTDYTWKISFNPSPTTRYRLKINPSLFTSDSKALNHDIIYTGGADAAAISTGSVQVWARSDWASDPSLAALPSQLLDSDRQKVAYNVSATTNIPSGTLIALLTADKDNVIKNQLSSGGEGYRKLKVLSSLYNSSFIWIECKFAGDYIKPSSFAQDLSTINKVQHSEIWTQKINVASADDLVSTYALTTTTATVSSLLNIAAAVSGPIITSNVRSNTTRKQIYTLPIVTKGVSIADGELLANQPIFLDATTGQVSYQASQLVSGATDTTSGIDTAWGTWKIDFYNFLIGSKKVNIASAPGGGAVVYSDAAVATANVNGASLLQFNSYDKTWQAGIASEAVAFASTEATYHGTAKGATLLGNLPFLLRSMDRKSTALAQRIPFYNNDTSGSDYAVKTDLLKSDAYFKYDVTTDATNHVLRVSNITLRNYDSSVTGYSNLSQVLTPSTISLGFDNSALQGTGEIGTSVFLYENHAVSSVAKATSVRFQLFNENLNLSISIPAGTITTLTSSTSMNSVLNYFTDRAASSIKDYLSLGHATAARNLTTDIVSKTLKFVSPTIYYGSANGSLSGNTQTNLLSITDPATNINHYFHGNVTMFVDGNGLTESAISLLTLRAANSDTTAAVNAPLISDGAASVRFTTTGLLRSPTIDKIWDYIRRISGSASAPALVSETDSLWGHAVVPYDFSLYSEVSSISSNPAITTYRPFTWATTADDAAAVSYGLTRGTTPKSLRQLEVDVLRTRFNTITLVNYIKGRKVDKGLSANDATAGTEAAGDYGSLWQLHKGELSYGSTAELASSYAAITAANGFASRTTGNLFLAANTGSDTAVPMSQVYLAADGIWHYLFEQVRLPVRAE